MDSLSKQIIEILSLPQFANLNKVQKNTVRECILTMLNHWFQATCFSA